MDCESPRVFEAQSFKNMNCAVYKKVNFINSSQNEGLSLSCIAISFTDLAQFHDTVIGVFFPGSFTI
jgi:hypothetical protein